MTDETDFKQQPEPTPATPPDSSATPRKHRTVVGMLLQYGVPIAISVGLCVLLFRDVDWRDMVEIVRTQCNFWWIGLAMVLTVLSHVIRAMRWRIQLQGLGIKVPLFAVILSIFGTYAVNLIFPRLGELWRTGYISRRQHVPFDRVFGSMIGDRLADTITVGLLVLAALLIAGKAMVDSLGQNREMYLRLMELLQSPWLWVGLIVIAVAAIVGWRLLARSALGRKIKEFCIGIWKGFAVIATMPGKGRWLLLSVLLWGCYFLQLYVCFFAFPQTREVALGCGVQAVFLCWVFSSVAMGVPSNGGIGPWQWAVIFGLSLYSSQVPGLTHEFSATFANLVMGCNTALLILLGLFTFICIAIQKRHAN